jgi:hypothetical protein
VLWTTSLSLLLAPRWRRFAWLSGVLELLLWVQMFLHGHVYAVGLVDAAMRPTWAPFWAVNHVRIAAMALFLAVTLATLRSELRAPTRARA